LGGLDRPGDGREDRPRRRGGTDLRHGLGRADCPKTAPEGKRNADRAAQIRERLKAALPEKGTVRFETLEAAVADLDPPVEHHELWQNIAPLQAEGALVATEVEKDVFTFSRATRALVTVSPDTPSNGPRSFRAGDLT
jgi:hypothetical protein